jgi:hypothetical protein
MSLEEPERASYRKESLLNLRVARRDQRFHFNLHFISPNLRDGSSILEISRTFRQLLSLYGDVKLIGCCFCCFGYIVQQAKGKPSNTINYHLDRLSNKMK